jgi:hypothetical protein
MSAHMGDESPDKVTEDELQAAIAEIENMSPAEAAAISEAGDGSQDAPDSTEQPSPSGPEPSDASVAEAPAERADAPAERADAPAEAAAISEAGGGSQDAPDSTEQASPSGPEPSDTSVADAPAEHADAPAEQADASAEQADAPAEQADAPAEQADAPAEQADAPQPPVQPDRAPSEPADSRDEPSDADQAGGVTEGVSTWVSRFRAGLSRAGLSRALARLRAGLGRKSADASPEDAPEQSAETEEGQSASIDEALPPKGICRLVDRALDTLNKPFDRFGSQVRNAIGFAAIATVVISVTALLVLPRMFPHRDAVSFLREKRAQLDARRTAPAPPESPAADNDSSSP